MILNLFTVFHLNLAYSSIEEERRPEVVRNCYWPLLRLARRHGLPFGIEASAYTLESVAEIDRSWVDELRALTTDGPCEFVGSGYGIPSQASIEAVKLFARTEGIILDPVYTGKAAAALIAHVRAGTLGPADTAVLVHTGGMPAVFTK